jgi:hypothetical protein
MRSIRILALFAIVASGCGSSSGGGTVACTNATGKTCLEVYASNTTTAGIALANADCTKGGGVVSEFCSHAGADGACKMDASQTGVTATVTIWYYAGTAASEMQSCTSRGDIWIAP